MDFPLAPRNADLVDGGRPASSRVIFGGAAWRAALVWRSLRLSRALRADLFQAWHSGDVPWFRDIGIQRRFTVLIGVAMMACVLVGAVYLMGERRIDSAIADQSGFQRIGDQAATFRAESLAMQTAANGLIGERKRRFIDDFEAQATVAAAALADLKVSPMAVSHGAEIDELDQALGDITTTFRAVAGLTLTLGLKEDDGLRGQLGASIKAIESELDMWPNTDDLKTKLLKMRQAEKDFMLFQKESYLGKHNKLAREFEFSIDAAGVGASTRDDFRELERHYVADMAAYGRSYLDQQARLTELRAKFTALQPRIDAFAAMARDGMAEATLRQDATRRQVGTLTALVGGFGMLAILGFGLVSGRSIARPVLAMEEAMNRLAAGENTIEIPGIDRGDEVGKMAKAVRVFRDNALAMEEMQVRQQAEHAAKAVRDRRRETMINAFDDDVGRIIRTVAISATDSEGSARDMDRFVADTVSQMEAVNHSSEAATANVQAMAAAAEQLALSVKEIAGQVSTASRMAGKASEAASRTDDIVRTLFERTQHIDSVVAFIGTIASQTRLLALNANIEASLAGEHGRGFIVVAEEVKRLASQTAQATKDITAQISAVQIAGRDAVAAISEIRDSVAEVDEVSATIAASVEEQSAATQEIARSAQEAAQGTTMVASSITWVVEEASKMKTSAAAMLDSSQHLSGQSEVLRAVVDNFLVGVQDGELTLKWGDVWLTGHPAIDADHEGLLACVNDLSAAMLRNQGHAACAGILDRLAEYTRQHFTREEQIWAEGGLSDLAEHARLHADFTARVVGFADEMRIGRPTLTVDLLGFLRDWLVSHVFKCDKAAIRRLSTAPLP
jgi:methyl-accepting chemotaxis protein